MRLRRAHRCETATLLDVLGRIAANVVRPNNRIITDDMGGRFGRDLTMQRFGGGETPHEVDARLRVVRRLLPFR